MSKKIKHISERKLLILSSLSEYTLKSALIRISVSGFVGALLLTLSALIINNKTISIPLATYIQVMVAFAAIVESNMAFDFYADRRYPIPERLHRRLLLHTLITLLLSILCIGYFAHLHPFANFLEQQIVWLMIILGLMFVVMFMLIIIGVKVINRWVAATQEIEQLKQAKLKYDNRLLHEQLNPHFLFNNLSVLKSMISHEPEQAVVFIENFTDIYRYVLQKTPHDTVSLAEECAFIKAYIGLQQERLGEGLQVQIDLPNNIMQRELPPLSLQLLVENAIKHNIASRKTPLNIDITSNDGDSITVSNNLNIKDIPHSTHTGLENLRLRYQSLSTQNIKIDNNGRQFIVTIPLL